jgi:hypothetical protein
MFVSANARRRFAFSCQHDVEAVAGVDAHAAEVLTDTERLADLTDAQAAPPRKPAKKHAAEDT